MNRTPRVHLVTLTPLQVELLRWSLQLLREQCSGPPQHHAISLRGLERKLEHCARIDALRQHPERT